MKPTNVTTYVYQSHGKRLGFLLNVTIERELNLPPIDGTKKNQEARNKLTRAIELAITKAVSEIEFE